MTVAGWGKTRQEALTSSRYLLETRVRLVDGATCQRNSIYSDNLEPNTMICAYNLGKDACQVGTYLIIKLNEVGFLTGDDVCLFKYTYGPCTYLSYEWQYACLLLYIRTKHTYNVY